MTPEPLPRLVSKVTGPHPDPQHPAPRPRAADALRDHLFCFCCCDSFNFSRFSDPLLVNYTTQIRAYLFLT